jgi:hypothetical protein
VKVWEPQHHPLLRWSSAKLLRLSLASAAERLTHTSFVSSSLLLSAAMKLTTELAEQIRVWIVEELPSMYVAGGAGGGGADAKARGRGH